MIRCDVSAVLIFVMHAASRNANAINATAREVISGSQSWRIGILRYETGDAMCDDIHPNSTSKLHGQC